MFACVRPSVFTDCSLVFALHFLVFAYSPREHNSYLCKAREPSQIGVHSCQT